MKVCEQKFLGLCNCCEGEFPDNAVIALCWINDNHGICLISLDVE